MQRRGRFSADRSTRALERICCDPSARRELLWLRAKGKGDEDDARALVEVDPGVRERLANLNDLERPDELDGRDRREAFEALWDEHYDRLARRFVGPASGP